MLIIIKVLSYFNYNPLAKTMFTMPGLISVGILESSLNLHLSNLKPIITCYTLHYVSESVKSVTLI